jgi:hypothetical protein
MIRQFQQYLDVFDYFAVCVQDSLSTSYTLYRRNLKAYQKLTSVQNLSEFDLDKLKLFSKDQKIPVFTLVLSPKIKEKTLLLNSVDNDEIAESIEKQKVNLFGQSRVRDAELTTQLLYQNEDSSTVFLQLLPKGIYRELELTEPFIPASVAYNSIVPIQKFDDGLYFYFHNSVCTIFNIQDSKQHFIETRFLTPFSDTDFINYINEQINYFKKSNGINRINSVTLINSPMNSLNQGNIIEKTLATSDVVNAIIHSESNCPEKTFNYLLKQRVLKFLLFLGTLFIALILFSELLAKSFELVGNFYSNSYIELAEPLSKINIEKQSLNNKERTFRELQLLFSKRSQQSNKIHMLASFFEKDCWIKSLSIKGDLIIVKGFALNRSNYAALLSKLNESKFYTVKPLLEKEMQRNELLKKENLNYAKLIYFESELRFEK